MEKKKEVKQVTNKSVKVRSFEVIEKEPIFDVPKWKLRIAKIFKIPVSKKFRYAFKINYYGSERLKPSDVITDEKGNIYTVLKEMNRMAMILTYKPMDHKPNLNCTLKIQGREK
ncbi:hypothetical protein M1M25_gp096 [Tenacibaculum phage Gundel_1]|uniref:Uncharacterized protein n=1 Tax=Tenacibaculum phage Gundel_1 TaxID=2745672 RepID=A0A8E4ZMA1_9CAUD|nr:hypothetical protein M1M25_gp096 [Tenacibaculum phage Gundel_1]QQV91534.1 hypothetical protein Gundel1_96 [Tenacibaculum phage Gundel_1]